MQSHCSDDLRINCIIPPSVSTRNPRGFCILCSSIRTQLEEKFKSINGELYKAYPQSKKEADETAETLTRNPNNLKLTQLTKVLIHNQLADKAKARLPTFSHNLHLATHHIFLTLNNIDQITTCRLFDSIQFCVCLIPRNAPHFFVSTSAIPVNRCLTEWILSVKTRLLTDKLFILNNLYYTEKG